MNNIYKFHREMAGLSQGDVSKVMGFSSPQMLSNIERGISHPTPEMLKVMAKLYSIEYDYLCAVLIDKKVEEYRAKLIKKFKVKNLCW